MAAEAAECSTPFGVEGSITMRTSYRRRIHRRCAQRLSASKVPSPDARQSGQGTARVLNAFRRRRFHHSATDASAASAAWCSTPFGVEGSITRSCSTHAGSCRCAQRLSASKVPSRGLQLTPIRRPSVLNAFRRRRFHHEVQIGEDGGEPMCSTPFGVEGSITCAPSPRRPAASCAQRLSASKVPSQRPERDRARLRRVLNAFRRRRFHHTRRRR